MPRTIESPNTGERKDFPPLVGLRTVGNFVKGTVTKIDKTTKGNPVVTLTLIDLNGSTSISKEKGVYSEVEVNVGDEVQVVGSVKELREKLPLLAIGDVVTITFEGKIKIKAGRTLNKFTVVVED